MKGYKNKAQYEKDYKEFLKQSNLIEGVKDKNSLRRAIEAWTYLQEQTVLTNDIVLNVHRILMQDQNLDQSEIGWFRRVPVWIGGRQGIDYRLINGSISDWVDEVNYFLREKNITNGITTWEDIKNHHIMYEKIHAFVDGNGRTGRMFMNWERLKIGLPILIIKADWPKADGEQKDYYSWFK